MKRTTTKLGLVGALMLAVSLPAPLMAQDTAFVPGENFVTTWDYDGDGKVTLAEVLERRGDLFSGFDADEDGVLSAEEMLMHDETRDAMQEANGETRPAQPMGNGQGGGRGNGGQGGGKGGGRGPNGGGNGGGQGMGPGGGQGGMGQMAMGTDEAAMLDANHDGTITREEFVAAGEPWFAFFDRDGNGEVLSTDFGPGRN